MSFISRRMCHHCQAVRTYQVLSSNLSSYVNKLFQSTSQEPSAACSASLNQRRYMSSKFKKEEKSVHRKDRAVKGEGDQMYEPQSPYKEHWPRHYGWDNNLFGGGALPKLDRPLEFKPPETRKDNWDKEHALFGQNDYIDILGDGHVRPVDLMQGPSWLRGFRGNEMQRIIRRLEFQGDKLRQLYPTQYHNIQKRLDFLFKVYNVRRSNRIGKGKTTVQK